MWKIAKIQFFGSEMVDYGTQNGTQNFRIEKYDVSAF